MTSLIGQTINDRYRLESLLGDGGMGTVYRGYDVNLERQVAIKLMHSHFARQAEFRARMEKEAKTAARMDHPSVVRVFDFGNSDHGLFIAMEYVDGGSLRQHLQRLQRLNKYLPMAQSLQIGIQIAEALDYAHRRGVIHRDVKPGNIILKRLNRPDEPGEHPFRALLTDFGLVKLQEGSLLTQSGATVGTPTYMSPEQCEGRHLSGRSDIYSLGIVLYELVTNRLPFAFQSLSDAISTHRRGTQPDTASAMRPDAPPLMDTLLARALAKSPEDRFENGHQMANALRSAKISLEGAPTQIVIRRELNILDKVDDPPPGYELRITTGATDDRNDNFVALDHSIVTLGRNADNDIVLPADGVSRHHARLQATSLGWELLDLGGINGTWIDDRRLRAEEPTPLVLGSTIRVGPYNLTLQGPELQSEVIIPSVLSTPGRITPRIHPAETAETATAVNPLSMFVVRDTISVDPGQQATVSVEVVNHTNVEDRVRLRVRGIPSSWIIAPTEFINLPAGGTTQVRVGIRPPRHRSTPVGRQRLRLELVSQHHRDQSLAASASLIINAFLAFDAQLEPQQIRLPGSVRVTVRNKGNVPAQFSVVAKDREGQLKFRGETGRLLVQPNESTQVNLQIESKRQSWLQEGALYPYDVMVRSQAGARQALSGEARTGSIVPVWLLYGLVFLVVVACVVTSIAYIVGGGRTSTSTPSIVFDIGATETSIVLTETAVSGTATPTSTPPVGTEGDADGDGLSDAQESTYGTNPQNPDTDGDGLTDGAEALTHGTNPTKADSDGDLLRDGDEVNIYHTNPLKADTDGDGISDAVEVSQGTDPLVPNNKPPTPVTPSATPVPGNTHTPAPSKTPDVAATQTAQKEAAQTAIAVTLTHIAAGPATQTAIIATVTAAASQTAVAATATQAAAVMTQTAAAGSATQTAVSATQTAVADAATQTAVSMTQTAVAGYTPTFTPTPEPTITPTLVPPVISCITLPSDPLDPAYWMDGVFNVTDWPSGPLLSFQPDGNPARLVQVYFGRDNAKHYLAFLINDSSNDPTDSLRIHFDTTNNGGDPDTADRFFQISRDNTQQVWAGFGNNTDTQNWDAGYSSSNWRAAIGEPGSGQWVVELEIDVPEIGALADPFGLMTQVQYTGEIATWPDGADGNSPGTWRDVRNTCP